MLSDGVLVGVLLVVGSYWVLDTFFVDWHNFVGLFACVGLLFVAVVKNGLFYTVELFFAVI